MKKIIPALIFSLLTLSAFAADYVYSSFGSTATFTVNGPFTDEIHFTIDTGGSYAFTVSSVKTIIACSGRYCRSPGTLYGHVTNAQLRDVNGVDIPGLSGSSVFTGNITLAPGDYTLEVSGTGAGTGRYIGSGQYNVNIKAPPSPPTCESVLQALMSQGYTEQQAEAIVATKRANGECVGGGD